MKFVLVTILFISYYGYVRSAVLLNCLQACDEILFQRRQVNKCKRQCYLEATRGGHAKSSLAECLEVCECLEDQDSKFDCSTGCSFLFNAPPTLTKKRNRDDGSDSQSKRSTRARNFTPIESTMMTWL